MGGQINSRQQHNVGLWGRLVINVKLLRKLWAVKKGNG